jgi:hypothetical protein
MWVYFQSSGNLIHNSLFIAKGYSGKGIFKDNPYAQIRPFQGPIPRGIYKVGTAFNSDKHGPFCLPLEPSGYNEMFGRNEFLVHGDSADHPGDASEGCVIMPRNVREAIANDEDKYLVVC